MNYLSFFRKPQTIIFFVWMFGFFLLISPVFAAPASGSITLKNPLADVDTPEKFIGVVIKGVLGLVGVVTLIMFLWGGFIWLFSFGEPERVKKGLNTMLWTGAGLVAIFASTVAIRWFLGVLTNTATR